MAFYRFVSFGTIAMIADIIEVDKMSNGTTFVFRKLTYRERYTLA